ncbi:substrate-binding domain-containing protein [Kineothrix sp. MB12-C1]|uniref:substrate-binding domain-containing protein n=1 Tax=Kineothrix sp. MB12-C1 TaxID=3070215 RepID=UPI0027D1F9CB|nr:substrate-binding domain-containing protein [Kineothrix sp. MB12-C1]WMC94060.1 substrate-binding domain-containing protein [Kineothrix sp. MB12-C1]
MNDKKEIRNILILVLIIAAVSTLIIVRFYGNNQNERYNISVIAGESHAERWIVLQQGVEKAGNDYNAQINFYTVANGGDAKEQKELINRELEKKVDAIIICAVDSREIQEVLQGNERRTPVILIETDLKPGHLYSQVSPDNYEMGYHLGEEFVRQQEGEETTAAILIDNDKIAAQQERVEGFEKALASAKNITIKWRASDYQSSEQVDNIISMDCVGTQSAIEISRAHNEKIRVYGFGNAETNIYYMDKGMIKVLVVPNDFNMGYLSVQNAVQAVEKDTAYKRTIVEHIVVTGDTLHKEENQRIIFPIVQ